MPAVMTTGPTIIQNLPFYPSGNWDHCKYSLVPPHRSGQVEMAWTA